MKSESIVLLEKLIAYEAENITVWFCFLSINFKKNKKVFFIKFIMVHGVLIANYEIHQHIGWCLSKYNRLYEVKLT